MYVVCVQEVAQLLCRNIEVELAAVNDLSSSLLASEYTAPMCSDGALGPNSCANEALKFTECMKQRSSGGKEAWRCEQEAEAYNNCATRTQEMAMMMMPSRLS